MARVRQSWPLVRGLRLIYNHRWHDGAGYAFALLTAVVTQILTAVFVAAAASRITFDVQLYLTRGKSCDCCTARYC